MTKEKQDNKRCTSYFNRLDQKYNVPIQGFSNKKNARENFMTSDEAVNDDKNYNGNVHSN